MTYQDPYATRPLEPAGSQVNVNASSGYTARVDPGPLYYTRRIFGFVYGVLAVLLLIRIVMLLGAANADNGIVAFIMTATWPFVAPFYGMFDVNEVQAVGQSVFDVAALVAIIGWGLLAALVIGILRVLDPSTRADA